jgi:hypothetical protein
MELAVSGKLIAKTNSNGIQPLLGAEIEVMLRIGSRNNKPSYLQPRE